MNNIIDLIYTWLPFFRTFIGSVNNGSYVNLRNIAHGSMNGLGLHCSITGVLSPSANSTQIVKIEGHQFKKPSLKYFQFSSAEYTTRFRDNCGSIKLKTFSL